MIPLNTINVLDHGFITLIDTMGDDQAISDAARISYGEGTKKPSDTRALIRYLMRHGHTSPFEMCEAKFHMKLPIFVARQWVRHRTANINEISARYSVLPEEFYVPEDFAICRQSETNKQGRGTAFDFEEASDIQNQISMASEESFQHYSDLLDEDVARETARIVLPLNAYTEWVWKCDLHNIFHLLRLRCDPHAQWEIREYANAMAQLVKAWVPLAFHAFVDYQLMSRKLSFMERGIFATLASRNAAAFRSLIDAHTGMSDREKREFLDDFLLNGE